MPALPSDLRRVLENAVIAARDEATTAAAAALKRLAVATKEFPNYLSADERVLRQKLRAAARQLGDPWNADKQAFATLNKLTHEVAYEHWHRMLFARFLAENNLLIHPEHGVPVDLATVADLAGEEARKTGTKADTWALAGRYAAAMLPQIFRPDDPALAVQLAPEHQQALEKILESLPPSVFTADDSLGWVYQFWQSAEKKRVNDSEEKITGDTLPCVTQLFTEHYMVLFLLHNTIGAWHAGKVLGTHAGRERAASCSNEAELREAVSVPGYSFEYLRFVRDDESPAKWRPAAGAYEGWPAAAKNLKALDPCCGSGHFLVAALELLVRLRMAEEGLDPRTAAISVIADNLFGLELDARCTQISAFNVATAAWKTGGEHFAIPEIHVACSGLGPSTTLEQWLKLADKQSSAWQGIPQHARQSVTNGLTNLHHLFSQAPELGSLIDPAQLGAGGELFSADWETLQPFLTSVMSREKDDDSHERAVAARGMAQAAEVLAGEYTLVLTNVPYLATRRQSTQLQSFCTREYPLAKNDLAVSFMLRLSHLLADGGTLALVMSQYWLFKSSYEDVRRLALKEWAWNILGRLGPGAFETISGEVVNVCAGVWTTGSPTKDPMPILDVIATQPASAKAEALATQAFTLVSQESQRDNPEARIVSGQRGSGTTLEDLAIVPQGVKTGDDDRWRRFRWEVPANCPGWINYQTTVRRHVPFGGRHLILDWRTGGKGMVRPRIENKAVGLRGVAISQSGALPATIYTGERFDSNVAPIVPIDQSLVPALWAFCTSDEYIEAVRQIDQSLKVTNGPLLQVPFEEDRWRRIAAETPKPLEPHSDDPTQWVFSGWPGAAAHATVLQVAVARVVGCRWPAEIDANLELASDSRALTERCISLEGFADDDGVVPLVPINNEKPGAERVRAVLEMVFGPKWTPGLLNDLLSVAGSPGKSLDDWLKHEFFAQHCAVFQQRPFIWQIWDGKKDGFNILVHYHRLADGDGKGHKLLTKITYTYLGDWIAQQQAAAKRGEAGADQRLKAAQDLQKQLEAILAGEPPYDIFVRWKPLHEQPLGWNPDINDGVRVNIRPFVTAGVLRGRVSVKWGKDGGREPESSRRMEEFPWFWSCPEDDPPTDFMGGDKFTGERLNDLHYTRKAKEAARELGGKGEAK